MSLFAVDDRMKEAESGAVSSNIDDESRMTILHLSLEEILRVACGAVDQGTGKNLGLQAVNQVNLISLVHAQPFIARTHSLSIGPCLYVHLSLVRYSLG